MFFSHCIQWLGTGDSNVRQDQVTDLSMIVFRLTSGVQFKKLDSIKTALLMIEAVKISWQREEGTSVSEESSRMFDNFVTYVYGKFSQPVAMALIKYAFKDRKLNSRKATKCANWPLVEKSLKPILIDQITDRSIKRLNSQFERTHRRLARCHNISECLQKFLASEIEHAGNGSVLSIDREILAA